MECIIPAAGLGTRFLPFTISVAKELLPLFHTPAIDIILQELLLNDILNVTIVINEHKKSIIDYLMPNEYINKTLYALHKDSLIQETKALHEKFTFSFVTQDSPLGLGHAVLQAKTDQPLISIILPDELLFKSSDTSSDFLKKMIVLSTQQDAHVLAVKRIPQNLVHRYGIIQYHKTDAQFFNVTGMVEKPDQENAPSDYAIIGRYLLKKSIFETLSRLQPGFGNEIQLTDGINMLLKKGEKVIALPCDDHRFDIGNPAGWFECLNFMHNKNFKK